jgi:curli biogenesis system outer membrane secretion channel CsgG
MTTKSLVFAAALVFLFGLTGIATAQNSTDTDNNETEVTSTEATSTTTVATSESPEGPAVTDNSRPRVAVREFENPAAYYASTIGTGLTSIIVTKLTQSGRFDIIQRGEGLELVIDEVDLGQSGYIEPDTAVEMGHVLGVQYILAGQVTYFGYEEQSTGGFLGGWGGFGGLDVTQQKAMVRMDFTLIDALTGQSVLAATAEGKSTDTGFSVEGGNWGDWVGSVGWESDEFMESKIGKATLKAVDNLLAQILAQFPIQAEILAVTPDFIILDIGAGAGIEQGMEFDVYRVTAVTNAAGEVVWEDKSLIGRIAVTEVDLTNCKAEVLSGTGFIEGDLCIHPEEIQASTGTDTDEEENPHRN